MHAELVWIYVLPFALAVVMPGWRLLLAYTVIVGGATLWAFIDINAALRDPTDDPGVGGVLVLTFISIGGAGALSGIVTRAVLLATGWRPRWRAAAIIVVGFVALPLGFFSLVRFHQWERRPPSQACLSTEFPIEVGGTIYRLPAAPIFSVATGKGDPGSVYYFDVNSSLREFCALSRRTEGPLHATALILRFDKLRARNAPRVKTFCDSAASPWERELCAPGSNPQALGYPQNPAMYVPDEYDHRRLLASGRASFRAFRQKVDEERQAAIPLQPQRVGDFERYPNGFWIARAGHLSELPGDPYTLYCRESGPDRVTCSTTHALKDGLQTTYDFVASPEDIVARAESVEAKLEALLAALQSKE